VFLSEEVNVVLMQFDPIRDFDRLVQQAWGRPREGLPAAMPMDAFRHGDTFVVHFDLPGVDPASIDLSVDRNTLTVTAERHWEPVEGDQVVARERQQGTFSRQLLLGDGLDTENIHASFDTGVLTITIPIAERARPRKIEVEATSSQQSITTQSG
jgi:HSP20 family protein